VAGKCKTSVNEIHTTENKTKLAKEGATRAVCGYKGHGSTVDQNMIQVYVMNILDDIMDSYVTIRGLSTVDGILRCTGLCLSALTLYVTSWS
jgi:hypothetical protein